MKKDGLEDGNSVEEPNMSVLERLANMDFQWLGGQICIVRKQNGLSLIDAAKQIGISKTTLHRLEGGDSISDFKTIMKILVWLGVDESEIQVVQEMRSVILPEGISSNLVLQVEEIIDEDSVLSVRDKVRLKKLFWVICETL